MLDVVWSVFPFSWTCSYENSSKEKEPMKQKKRVRQLNPPVLFQRHVTDIIDQ